MSPSDVSSFSTVARLATRLAAAGVVLAAAAATASARPARRGHDAVHRVRATAQPAFARRGPIIVYVNRGGGVVGPGDDDSRHNTSSLADGARIRVPAWGGGDAAWRKTMACVRDRFSPFDVDIVEQRPASGDYIMAMVGGEPSMLGYPEQVSGVAPFTGGVMSSSVVFVFAEGIEYDPEVTCVDILHEVGHALGLDHEYLCEDPMSYLWDCEQPKTFQDVDADCGEDEPRACSSGSSTQNSYRVLARNVGLRAGAAPPRPAPVSPAPPATSAPPDDGGGGAWPDDDGSGWSDDGGGGSGDPGPATWPDDGGGDDGGAGPADPPAGSSRLSIEVEGPSGVLSGNRVVTIVVTAHGDGIRDATLGWASDDATYALACGAIPAGAPATCRRDGDTFVFQLEVGTGRRYYAAQIVDRAGHELATDISQFYLTK